MGFSETASSVDLTIPAVANELARAHGAVEAFAERHDLPPRAAYALELIVEELVTNVVEHGYDGLPAGLIRLHVEISDGVVTGEIVDEGHAFDPTAVSAADTTMGIDERPIGGLGVFLVHKFVDALNYERQGNRNILRFRITAGRA